MFNPKPMNKKTFEKTGRAIEQIEKVTGGPIDKLFSGLFKDDGWTPGNWKVDAQWAEIEEKPLKSKILIYTIGLTFLALIIWISIARVDEVVTGQGVAKPVSGTQIVQAVDGGMVEEILVKESQHVDKGDVLVKINETRYSSSLQERNTNVGALVVKKNRLEALTQNRPFIVSEKLRKEMPDIVEQERNLYNTSLEQRQASIKIAGELARQRRQELIEAKSRLSQLNSACELAENEMRATKGLLKSGAVSELEVIRLEKDVSRAKADRNQAKAQITRTVSAIREAESQIRETNLRFINAWRNELTATLRELETLKEGSKALEDRVSQAEIKAPSSGTIKRLFVNSEGAVLMPGGAVAEIVSNKDELIVEAKVTPEKRSFIKPGMNVVVKFTSYEFSVYGGLPGKVEYVGPDTITDPNGFTYYTVRVKTDETSFGKNRPVLPGMIAQVDIITGNRTILSYILRPLFRARERAFKEH